MRRYHANGRSEAHTQAIEGRRGVPLTDEHRAAVRAGQLRFWEGRDDRRQAYSEQGQRWWRSSKDDLWIVWHDRRCEALDQPFLPPLSDPRINPTIEALNQMAFPEYDPFEEWADDGQPIRTLFDRLNAVWATFEAVLYDIAEGRFVSPGQPAPPNYRAR